MPCNYRANGCNVWMTERAERNLSYAKIIYIIKKSKFGKDVLKYFKTAGFENCAQPDGVCKIFCSLLLVRRLVGAVGNAGWCIKIHPPCINIPDELSLRRDAHSPVWSEGFDVQARRYETDEVTGGEVVNRFDAVSDHIKTYLSRADLDGTMPTMPASITAV